MNVKTYDELRASPPGTICEHGGRERSCPHCESNAADQEVERLEARLEEVEWGRDELKQQVDDWQLVTGFESVDLFRNREHDLQSELEARDHECSKLKAERDELARKVAELEFEADLRSGVRYPEHTPDRECIEVWTLWRNECEKPRWQWISRSRCSLVDGEFWRVYTHDGPNECKEGG